MFRYQGMGTGPPPIAATLDWPKTRSSRPLSPSLISLINKRLEFRPTGLVWTQDRQIETHNYPSNSIICKCNVASVRQSNGAAPRERSKLTNQISTCSLIIANWIWTLAVPHMVGNTQGTWLQVLNARDDALPFFTEGAFASSLIFQGPQFTATSWVPVHGLALESHAWSGLPAEQLVKSQTTFLVLRGVEQITTKQWAQIVSSVASGGFIAVVYYNRYVLLFEKSGTDCHLVRTESPLPCLPVDRSGLLPQEISPNVYDITKASTLDLLPLIPSDAPKFYFEVTLLAKSDNQTTCMISICNSLGNVEMGFVTNATVRTTIGAGVSRANGALVYTLQGQVVQTITLTDPRAELRPMLRVTGPCRIGISFLAANQKYQTLAEPIDPQFFVGTSYTPVPPIDLSRNPNSSKRELFPAGTPPAVDVSESLRRLEKFWSSKDLRVPWLSDLAKAVQPAARQNSEILHVGCRSGVFSLLLSSFSPKGSVTGLDIDNQKVKVATQALQLLQADGANFRHLAIDFLGDNAHDANFAMSFDIVVVEANCTHEDAQRLLKLLKPTGTLFAFMNNAVVSITARGQLTQCSTTAFGGVGTLKPRGPQTLWIPETGSIVQSPENPLMVSFTPVKRHQDGETRDPTMFRSVSALATDVPGFYFEVKIIDSSTLIPIVGIGFAEKRRYFQVKEPVRAMPGWKLGIAMHTDDGVVFEGKDAKYEAFANPCAKGDTVGCGWNRATGVVFWTRNGIYLGSKVESMSQRVYPIIGMDASSCTVLINFGQQPFAFKPKIDREMCSQCGGSGSFLSRKALRPQVCSHAAPRTRTALFSHPQLRESRLGPPKLTCKECSGVLNQSHVQCLQCPQYFLCFECQRKSKPLYAGSHLFTHPCRITNAVVVQDVTSELWSCDGCGHQLVKAKFWSCTECGYEAENTSYDLCGKCFRQQKTSKAHTTSHRMVQVNSRHVAIHLNPEPVSQASRRASSPPSKLFMPTTQARPSSVWPSSNAFGGGPAPLPPQQANPISTLVTISTASPSFGGRHQQQANPFLPSPVLTGRDCFGPAVPKRHLVSQSNPPVSPEKFQNFTGYRLQQNATPDRPTIDQQTPYTEMDAPPLPRTRHAHSHSPSTLHAVPHHHRSLSVPASPKKMNNSSSQPSLAQTTPAPLTASQPPPSPVAERAQSTPTLARPIIHAEDSELSEPAIELSSLVAFASEGDFEMWARLIGLGIYPKFLKHVTPKSALAFDAESDTETFLFLLSNNQQALQIFVREVERLRSHLKSINMLPSSPRPTATSSESVSPNSPRSPHIDSLAASVDQLSLASSPPRTYTFNTGSGGPMSTSPTEKKILEMVYGEKIDTSPVVSSPPTKHAEVYSNNSLPLPLPLIPWEKLKVSENPVSAGAFGQVFKAGPYCGVDVAVKVLHSSSQEIVEQQEEALRREANMLMQANYHPHVIRLVGLTRRLGKLAIVTSWADKGSLLNLLRNTRLNKVPKLTWAQIISIARDAAAGMTFLHSNSILHRDLACRNILVNAAGEGLIADLGLSGVKDPSKSRMSVQAHYKWMSPEWIRGDRVDESSDVFSFGVCLFEMLSFGEIPYPDMRDLDVAVEIKLGKAPKLELPPDSYKDQVIQDLLAQCTQEDRSLRPTFEQCLEILIKHVEHIKLQASGGDHGEPS